MHDVTEGGIATGLQEVAWASKVGIRVDEKNIPVFEETKKICDALGIDPLKTISSGMLIIAADAKKANEIVEALKKASIQGKIIGEVVKKDEGAYIQRKDGSKLDLSKPLEEELWKCLKLK
jgi:hydrogenase maturation factor